MHVGMLHCIYTISIIYSMIGRSIADMSDLRRHIY